MENDRYEYKPSRAIYFIIFAAAAILLLSVYLTTHLYKVQNCQEISRASSKSEKEINLPFMYYEDLTISVNIDKNNLRGDEVLFFTSDNCSFEISANGKILYGQDKKSGYQKSCVNILQLPESNLQNIELKISSDSISYNISEMYICSESVAKNIVFLSSLPHLLLSFFCAVILGILLFCIACSKEKKKKIKLSIALAFILSIIVFVICNTPFFYFALSSHTSLFIVSCVSIIIMNICGLLYLACSMSFRINKLAFGMLVSQCALAVFIILCLFINALARILPFVIYSMTLPILTYFFCSLRNLKNRLSIIYSILTILAVCLAVAVVVFTPYIIFDNALLIYVCSLHLFFDVFKYVANVLVKLNVFIMSQDTLENMAYKDCLTGIYNRASFQEDIDVINNSSDIESTYLLILDINNLKTVNDTLGHCYGDSIIQKVANCVYTSFAHIGRTYRIGGDEFAVIVRFASSIDIEKALRNFRNNIKRNNVDVAYAMKKFESSQDNGMDDFLRRVDTLMYEQKNKMKKIEKERST